MTLLYIKYTTVYHARSCICKNLVKGLSNLLLPSGHINFKDEVIV